MDEPLTKDKAALEALANKLDKRFSSYASDRRQTEAQWMRNLRQYLGIYDPDVKKNIAPDRSHAYPRITRVKVVSMVSRLMALLFPTGEKNWGLSASPMPDLDVVGLTAAFQHWAQANPEAQVTQDNIDDVIQAWAVSQAKSAERLIDDQLRSAGGAPDIDYVALVRQVVMSAVLYSVGVLRGPMTRAYTAARPVLLETGAWTIQEQVNYAPMFDFVSVWDWFPDLNAKGFASMDGEFERHVLSKDQMNKLKEAPGFDADAIAEFLRDNPDGNWNKRSFETDLEGMGDTEARTRSTTGKYEVLSWWGFISKADLKAYGVAVSEDDANEGMIGNVWFSGSRVFKVVKSPYPEGINYYHRFVFEEDEVNLVGSGLPPIMRDSQLAICSSARMLIDNAAVACGPQLEVDIDRLREGQDYRSIAAFKVWYTENTAYGPAGSGARAINSITIDSHTTELLAMMDRFMQLADAETFVSPQNGGDNEVPGSEAMRTVSGASMMLGKSALPFRDVVRNFDRFTMSVIAALHAWNQIFNADKVRGDLQPVARGATSLIAKEMRAMSLDSLVNTLQPEERVYVDWKGIVTSRVSARDLSAAEVLVPDHISEKRIAASDQAAAEAAEMQKRAQESDIRAILAKAFKDIAQAKKNAAGASLSEFDSIVAAIEKGVDPHVAASFTTPPADNPTAGAAQLPGAAPDGTTAGAGFA